MRALFLSVIGTLLLVSCQQVKTGGVNEKSNILELSNKAQIQNPYDDQVYLPGTGIDSGESSEEMVQTQGVVYGTPGHLVTWPNGIIPVTFDEAMTPSRKAAFLDACAEWANIGNVQCRVQASGGVRVSGGGGAVASIGAANPPNSGFISIGSCWWKGCYVHEIGHSLGFFHEHERNDRNQYVIANGGMIGGFPNTILTGYYDFTSIMHYFEDANIRPRDEWVNRYHQQTGRNLHQDMGRYFMPDLASQGYLSEGDEDSIIAMYGPRGGGPLPDPTPAATPSPNPSPASSPAPTGGSRSAALNLTVPSSIHHGDTLEVSVLP